MKLELISIELDGFRDFDRNQKVDFRQNSVHAILGVNKDDGGSNASGKSSFIMAIPVNLYGPKAVDVTAADLKNWHMKVPARTIGHYRVDGVDLIVDRTIGGKFSITHGGISFEGKVEDTQDKLNKILKLTVDQFIALSHKAQEDEVPFLLKSDEKKKDFLSSFFDIKHYDAAAEKLDQDRRDNSAKLNQISGRLLAISQSISDCKKRVEDNQQVLSILQQRQPEIDAKRISLKEIAEKIASIDILLSNKENLKSNPAYAAAESAHYQLQQKNVDRLTELDKTEKTVGALKGELLVSLSKPVIVPEEMTAALASLDAEIASNRSLIAKRDKALASAEAVKSQIGRKLQEIRSLDNAPKTCGSCGQNLPNLEQMKLHIENHNAQVVEQARALEQQMNTHLDDAHLIGSATVDEESLKKARDAKQAEIADYLAENSNANLRMQLQTVEADLRTIAINRKSLLSEIENSSQNLNGILMKIQSELNAGRHEWFKEQAALSKAVEMYDLEVKSASDRLTAAQSDLIQANKNFMQIQNEKLELEIEAAVIEKAAYVLSRNGFFGYIFDGILDDLNREINVNLKMIPNVRKYSLQFTPDKVTKTTGAVSKSITFEIKCGSKTVAYKPLSGGEKLGLIIAVDEALDTVLSRRLGVNIGWKTLDEQFTWIDSNSKEAILEFYKNKSAQKMYFLIDHASEFNASVDARLVITKRNEIARVAYA